MKQKRKRQEAAFKARVALEAMKGSKTICEIAGEFGIHPGRVADWKKVLAEGLPGVFDKGAPARAEVVDGEGAQRQPLDGLNDEVDQIILGDPVAQVGREKQGGWRSMLMKRATIKAFKQNAPGLKSPTGS